MYRGILSLSFLLAFFVPLFSSAQFVPVTIDDIKNDVNVYSDPMYPKKGQDFTITLESYAINLQASNITFYANDKVIQSLAGATKVTIPNDSDKITVRAVIETPEGRFVEVQKIIVPNTVSLMWQANTYIPPFYKGKALLSDGSSLLVSAMTNVGDENGRTIPSSDLVYTWKVNNKVKNDLSGLGRNQIVFDETIVDTIVSVSVVATSKDKRYGASDFINIPYKEPQIVIYKNDPLYGISKTSFGNEYKTPEKEFSIFAIPFFYKTQRSAENLSYNWLINGQKVTNENTNDITLRNESGKTGIVEVRLTIDSLLDKYQTAKKKLLIEITK